MNTQRIADHLPDAAVLAGFLTLVFGIARLSVAWALIVAGALLFTLGLAAALATLRRRT